MTGTETKASVVPSPADRRGKGVLDLYGALKLTKTHIRLLVCNSFEGQYQLVRGSNTQSLLYPGLLQPMTVMWGQPHTLLLLVEAANLALPPEANHLIPGSFPTKTNLTLMLSLTLIHTRFLPLELVTLFSGLFVTLPTAITCVSLFPCSRAAQPGPTSNVSNRPRTGCSSPTGPTTEHRTSTLGAEGCRQQIHDYEV